VELLSEYCIALGKVFIISGPTASGKSDFALKRALEKNGVIINADSLQVYKSLEILTAQPAPQACLEIPHRLYGFLDPSQHFSVGKWLSLAHQEIENALENNKLPFIVGGTGLYLKTLMEGLSPIPPISPDIRKMIKDDQTQNYEELKKVDPVLASRISPQDCQRTQRALEVFHGTEKPLSFWQQQKPCPPPYNFHVHILIPPKDELEKRMTSRLESMVKCGLVEEIKDLLTRPLSTNAKKAIGFYEFAGYVNGTCTFEEAFKLTLLHTRQYAKRQMTWFRHQFKNI